MVEQPKKTLTFCAMQYGIYMGVYLFMTFLFSVWSRYASIFNTLGALLLIATPAAVYLIMSHFVRRQGWPCRFVILWLLGICVFFFAALISGLGEYVYCQYIDPDFIPEQIDAMLKVLESAELDSPEMSDFIATMRSGFEHGALPTAIELVFQMIWTKVFLGSLLSIFVALFVCMYYNFQKSK